MSTVVMVTEDRSGHEHRKDFKDFDDEFDAKVFMRENLDAFKRSMPNFAYFELKEE